ncbi:hypothetical protein PACILC2_44400 [Paenibacillus cisolokensis]|uniref:isocitrate dehydrogenase (NADP(+)) n=1 Tax=Paenibacillus cisolokensis TaxID=1658519 RepID=A0ABQ4NCD6_9BACL|nr:hypothetical protein PACILC2_44400 [Paenibacillus cisolokensis]
MKLEKYALPTEGEKITIDNGKLQVPNNPVIPFIEGDGTGRDIWRASKRVLDAAVEKAYKGEKNWHGMKCMPAKKPIILTANGCRTTRWK